MARMLVDMVLLAALATAGSAFAAEAPALRDLSAAGTELLRNGDLRAADGDRAANWAPYEGGYRLAAAAGRNGAPAILCESAAAPGRMGAGQTLTLSRTRTAPLLASGWSKAEGVSGSADGDYSLYVDLVYTDGTPLWGRIAPFATGTHDWRKAEVLIVPEKPVASLTFYCLFRGHRGRVWFSDLSLREFDPGVGGTVFDGRPVQRGAGAAAPPGGRPISTKDGLSFRYHPGHGSVAGLRLEGRAVPEAGAPAGFLARDDAAGAAVYPFTDGRCRALGLSLTAKLTAAADHVTVEGEVKDDSGKDRAITLFFALPFPRAGAAWHDDARRTRKPAAGDYVNAAGIGSGATGTLSRYPWACVTGPAGGLAMGIDMDRPAQYRLFYNADLQALVLAYDFGLVKETRHFPSAAPFRFVLFRVDREWGFRDAAARFYKIFPQDYAVRSKEQGIWMPFTDVSTVQGWQDFGFRYHEGDNNVPFDDQAGILSFPYTEPSTYWMKMPKEMPRTQEAAAAELHRLRDAGNPGERRWATAALNAAIYGPDGQPQCRLLDTPWCDGAVWGLCPLPEIAGEPNAATLHWNAQVKEAKYGPKAKGIRDGEYLDSLEGYVTPDLNYRRDHFAAVNAPLTFDTTLHQPAIQKGLAVWEFERWMAADVHAMNKLMFANAVPYRFAFLTGCLDVMGTETNWLSGSGDYRPADDAQLLQFRTLSGGKPYLLLMNTDYDKLVPALVERYFQRSLFYGIYPSMFSHNASDNPYWGNPKWYNRDRDLFKRYIPAIRQIAEAGWQPVTLAHCEQAFVERFGSGGDGASYFTLGNQTDKPVQAELRLSPGAPAGSRLVDLVSGESFPLTAGKATIPLGPDAARALKVTR